MQRVSGCQRWWSIMSLGSQLEEMRSGRWGLAGRGPYCCLCQLGWTPSPRSIEIPGQQSKRKLSFTNWGGLLVCVSCVKLRSASQWLNSAHLAVLAFKRYFFHDALTNRVLILVHNSQKYFFVPAFWDLSTHPFNSLHIYPSSCLHHYISVYTPKHIAAYTPLYLSTHLSTHLSTPYTCSAIHLSTHPSISNFPSTQLSVYPIFSIYSCLSTQPLSTH